MGNSPDNTVVRETIYIAGFEIIFSLIMQLVFLFFLKWDYTVLLGNILGGVFAVLNFFLMGVTVSKAVTKEESEAKKLMKTSLSLRQLMILAVAAIGGIAPCFSIWTVVISLVFPRIAIALRPLLGNTIK